MMVEPIPSINKVFSLVVQQERQMNYVTMLNQRFSLIKFQDLRSIAQEILVLPEEDNLQLVKDKLMDLLKYALIVENLNTPQTLITKSMVTRLASSLGIMAHLISMLQLLKL